MSSSFSKSETPKISRSFPIFSSFRWQIATFFKKKKFSVLFFNHYIRTHVTPYYHYSARHNYLPLPLITAAHPFFRETWWIQADDCIKGPLFLHRLFSPPYFGESYIHCHTSKSNLATSSRKKTKIHQELWECLKLVNMQIYWHIPGITWPYLSSWLISARRWP